MISMIWRVEIKNKKNISDAYAREIERSITELGLDKGVRVSVLRIYILEGPLSKDQACVIAEELLVDPVVQDYTLFSSCGPKPLKQSKGRHVVEIAYNQGVMDPVEASTIKGIRDLGLSIQSVRTATRYFLKGTLSLKDIGLITSKVLSNKIIQHVVSPQSVFKPIVATHKAIQVKTIDLLKANDKELKRLSQDGQLFLSLDEMKTIQQHFRREKRNPTDCELETIAQTWSEHCYHKTFRGTIRYTYVNKEGQKKARIIKNLLKSTIAKATYELNKSWCVSVFHDNAGVIKFDEEDCLCFKVETHNHPSALEPFGGANTGIGGVIRDILGTGLGAKPICSTDVFCFASPDMLFNELPIGALHPKRVMKGVVSGVRDYGNKMGIPTVNGAIIFDPKFVGNPLVYCGNVGIMPKNKVHKKVYEGDYVVVAGGRTGRDGIHGATFSSGELTEDSEEVSSGAVQIGNPIEEKKVQDALLKARDQKLYSALTDCGAGGLSSAVGEMGEHIGVKVDLEKVPLKYDGLNYDEIWISESQERMVMSVPPANVQLLLDVFESEHVEATVIGRFTGKKRLEIFYDGVRVCDLAMSFLYNGNPMVTKEALWQEPTIKPLTVSSKIDLTDDLCRVLGHYNVCSKEWVIRQYDHEVQGGSIIKPLVGVHTDGPSDASVIAPKFGSTKGFAVSNGINARFGMIDPYWMAASCIDEAIRQIVAVGGRLDRIAILDNFCWGNPDKPDRLGGLVRAAEGCYQTAVDYQVPFISGKDSLYNEYAQGKKSIAIPGTLLISAIGIVDDVRKTITMDFKKAGNYIYCVGATDDEMGGSIYGDIHKSCAGDVPKVNTAQGLATFKALAKTIQNQYVCAAHDCSEGGLAVCLAEMAFSGDLGVTVRLDQVPYIGKRSQDNVILFAESNSRLVVEVVPEYQQAFESMMKTVPHACIGRVEASPEVIFYGLNQEVCVLTDITTLKEAWQKPLRWS